MHGNILCIYNESADGKIQEQTIHSKNQLMDYGNKVDDTTMKLGGYQRIIAHGGYMILLSMHNRLCYLKQCIPTSEKCVRYRK